MATVVDGVLQEWGDQAFYRIPRKGRRCVTVTGTKVIKKAGPNTAIRSPRALKSAIRAAARKAPEVMVKISGSGKGVGQLRAHLQYISRNGKLSLETDDGQQVEGRAAVRDLAEEWKYGLYGMPEEGRRRESLNIVLSMPPGTDPDAVQTAASDFAKQQFGNERPYAFVAHDDEKHPHVHLCVKVLGRDGTRLNPRKADLQMWREQFAESLRANGIEASATPRRARGTRQKTVSQARYHREGGAPQRNQQKRSFPSERAQLASYAKLAKQLASTDREGASLALDVTRIASQMTGVQEHLEASKRTKAAKDRPSHQKQKAPDQERS
jgi:type IV secretory pathway VirD2 relaxase